MGDETASRSVGIWAYPWDLASEGPEAVAEYCTRHGISSVSLAAVYHSGQILSLTPSPHWVNAASGPLVDLTSESPPEMREFVPSLKSRLAGVGVRLHGWVVLNHDKLGWMPIVSADRQHLGHTACPAANRERLARLLRELDSAGWFDELHLELPDWIDAVHGAHHEIVGVTLTPLLRLLLSLCFCEECHDQFGAEVNWEALRHKVLADIAFYLDAEPAPPEPFVQMATYLVENPDITALLRLRSRWLGDFMVHVQSTLSTPLVPMVTAHQLHGELSWMAGFVPDAARFSQIILLGYGTPDVVSQDLIWLAHKGWAMDRVIMGQTLAAWATSDLAVARRRLEDALEAGVQRSIFYNWGILNGPRRRWLGELCALASAEN
jgi:hypothetical protein